MTLITLIILMTPLILFDIISRVSMIKQIACAIRSRGVSIRITQQLRRLFEGPIKMSGIVTSTRVLPAEPIAPSSNMQPNMTIYWGSKLFTGCIIANVSHVILLGVMAVFLINFLQISIGEAGLLFAESQAFPRFVICQISEENIGFSNKMTYNCAIPSNVLVERLIYTLSLWLLLAIIWNITCLLHMLYKSRKSSRLVTWNYYNTDAEMRTKEYDGFIDYMSLDRHLVLLIFQANLPRNDFNSFYLAIFNEFETKVFTSED